MTDKFSITVYCDEAGTEKEDHYTIAGIILPDDQAEKFNMQMDRLKKTYFPKTPSEVILHSSDIQGRSGIYSKAKMSDKVYADFKYDLRKLVMERLKPKSAAFYFSKRELSELRNVKVFKRMLKNVRKPSVYVTAYFFMILKLQNYFVEKDVKWKIVAEEGNAHFGRLIDYFEKNRDNFAFNLVGNLERNLIGKQCIVSKSENAVQIADIIAYTINDFHKGVEFGYEGETLVARFTKDISQWEQKRILPYENLKDLFVWEECHSWRSTMVRMRGDN